MKSIIKKINVLGLAAVFAAGGMALAFTEKSELTEFGKLADGTWEEVGSRTPGENPGEYTCDLSEEICRAYFESQPLPNAEPDPENISDDGTYAVH